MRPPPTRWAGHALWLWLWLPLACNAPARFPLLSALDGDDTADTGAPCPPQDWYGDADGDGYGGQQFMTSACTPPSGYVENDDDCDDLNGSTHPGAPEVCGDGVDNDCNNEPEDTCLQSLSEGWALLGERANEGGFILAVGDLDGDRLAEVALGIPASSNGSGQENDGAVALFWGPHTADRRLSAADVTITGDAGEVDVVGWGVLLPGDVDGDGLGDLVVTASQYDDPSGVSTGAVAMFSGAQLREAGAGGPLLLGDSDWIWYGDERRVYFGATIAAADLDDQPDTIELISSAPWKDSERGTIYLLAGGGGTAADAAATFTGEADGDRLGVDGTVAAADITGDGVSDLAIGAYRRNKDSGGMYLCTGPFSGVQALADCAARIEPEGAEDQLGRRLARAGDANGDGWMDLWVTAPDEDNQSIDDGTAYLILGAPTLEGLHAQTATAAAQAQVRGLDAEDHLGDAIADGGDVNNDGIDDALMGASQLGQIEQGVAILFYGPLEGSLLSGAGDAIYTSDEGTDRAGEHVAFLPNLNTIGQTGLLVDAPENDQAESNAGAAWIVPLSP